MVLSLFHKSSQFMKSNGVKHIKCSPYHPSSNGTVERFIQTFKRSLKATQLQGRSVDQRICEFLLSYRMTPHATTNELPSVLFMKRPLRTRLDLLTPNTESENRLNRRKIMMSLQNKESFVQVV